MPIVKRIKSVKVPAAEKEAALAEYLKLVEAYKVQNPVKYELKKEVFDARLAELGYKAK